MAEEIKLNLIQKLAKIRELAAVAEKENEGYNYTYVDIAVILANVTAGMKKYGVSLQPRILSDTVSVEQDVRRETKKGAQNTVYEKITTEMLVKGYMEYVWIDNDNPEDRVVIPWFMVGEQSDPSQAMGAGLTYSMRQFLCNFFQIAQVDGDSMDVEQYRKKQKEAEDREDQIVLDSIIEEINKLVNDFVGEFPKEKTAMVALLKKFEKSANYTKITDINKASACLADVKKFILEKQDVRKSGKATKDKAAKVKEEEE